MKVVATNQNLYKFLSFMNKTTNACASGCQLKAYAKPQIKVAEIKGADVICTSEKPLISVSGNNFEEEEDW